MVGISITAIGIPELGRFLSTKLANTQKEVKAGILKSAVFLQGEVKQSIAGHRNETISVDTGRFLNSVGFTAGDTTGTVFSAVPYAGKLEFGTNFKNSPRKHFRNSASRAQDKIKQIIQVEIDKI